jgi:deoxyribodipyrimidine photo-lyase
MKACSIVLFRNDLRIEDHEPLTRACLSGMPVVALYVFEKYQYTTTNHYGFPKTGAPRAQFIMESVKDLENQLAALNIPLFVRFGTTDDVISNLISSLMPIGLFPTNIHYSIELGSEEQTVIALAKEKFPDLKWHSYWTKGLYKLEWFNPIDSIPDLFTTFRQKVEKQFIVCQSLSIPKVLSPNQKEVWHACPKDEWVQFPSWEMLKLNKPILSKKRTYDFIGGSTTGQARLEDYLFGTDAIATYKETRNGMLRPNDSSRLSPWLAQGCLSPRQVYTQIKHYEIERLRNDSTYWLFFELLWREFFILMHFKYGDRLFFQQGIQQRKKDWKENEEQMHRWLEGRTNAPLVDASMHELIETGFTTNRARQNAASFLTQTWKIDWLLGAEYYESQLIDYDPASNYGNWQYLAGIGNDARQDRWFDVTKQAKQYDPKGEYVKHWG